MSINGRLKEVRKMLNYNQEQFAKNLGISRAHISNIENGKDNPSSALIKLTCMKFNIDEEWLTHGVGSPEPAVDLSSREGFLQKYEASRVRLEKLLRDCPSNDLVSIVSAHSLLVGLLDLPKGMRGSTLEENDTHEYIRALCDVISGLEKLVFSVTLKKSLLPSKQDAAGWLKFKNDSDEQLEKLVSSAKDAVNIYLRKYGDGMKL